MRDGVIKYGKLPNKEWSTMCKITLIGKWGEMGLMEYSLRIIENASHWGEISDNIWCILKWWPTSARSQPRRGTCEVKRAHSQIISYRVFELKKSYVWALHILEIITTIGFLLLLGHLISHDIKESILVELNAHLL